MEIISRRIYSLGDEIRYSVQELKARALLRVNKALQEKGEQQLSSNASWGEIDKAARRLGLSLDFNKD